MVNSKLYDPRKKSNSEFKAAAEKICSILSSKNIKASPYANSDLSIFNSLSSENQNTALFHLNFYIESLETVISNGQDIGNNTQALWVALKKLNLKPSSDFFSFLKEEDCIELYDMENIQIWRNLNMMMVMSHTIEQIFCLPWSQRYERDPIALKECITTIQEILRNQRATTKLVSVKNDVFEKNSQSLFHLDVVHTCAASVTDNSGRNAGYIIVSSVKIIGANKRVASFDEQTIATPFL